MKYKIQQTIWFIVCVYIALLRYLLYINKMFMEMNAFIKWYENKLIINQSFGNYVWNIWIEAAVYRTNCLERFHRSVREQKPRIVWTKKKSFVIKSSRKLWRTIGARDKKKLCARAVRGGGSSPTRMWSTKRQLAVDCTVPELNLCATSGIY